MAYLEKHEIDAMLSVPDRARAQGRRDYALLLFLYNTGARASEAARATVADLAPDTLSVRLDGKGRKNPYLSTVVAHRRGPSRSARTTDRRPP